MESTAQVKFKSWVFSGTQSRGWPVFIDLGGSSSDKAPYNGSTSDSARRGAEDQGDIHNSKNKDNTSTNKYVYTILKRQF